MGASKSTTKTTKVAEPTMPESVPIKAAATATKLQAKESTPVSTPISLPTKSWRALLEEQPLNAEAKTFQPRQAPLPRKNRDNLAELNAAKQASPSAAKDTDPEWMQYLSKKLETKLETNGSAPDGPNKFQPSGYSQLLQGSLGKRNKGKGKGKGAPTAIPLDAGSPGGGGGVMIHTEAYLKLLKEGGGKKRLPINSQTARRTQNKNSDEASTELPMTMSSLAKKWSSVAQNLGVASDTTAEEVTERSTQDDIGIEKLLYDEDLSDPAYYSDTEDGNKKNKSSMHRVGRRPSLVTSAIRTYVMQDLSFELDQTVGMLLLRLQRFMDLQRIFGLSDTITEQRVQQLQQRRFVIGLKEVSRRTKHGKVECLIVAPDIEEDTNSGGLDDRMRELIAQAYENGTPVIFALSRSRLGKALGKSLHISVLGILDSTGTQGFLEESKRLASEGRQAWLARLAK